MTIKELELRVKALENDMVPRVIATRVLYYDFMPVKKRHNYYIHYKILGKTVTVTGQGKNKMSAAKDAKIQLARKVNELIFYPTLTVCEDI